MMEKNNINQRKKIKIKYIGFWDGFNPEEFLMTKILQKHFDVEICERADYIITSCIKDYYGFLDYDQVRIEYIGENYIPDLNMIDYAITPYPIQFLDRCFHLPQGLKSSEVNEYCAKRHEIGFDKKTIEEKTIFANFCASHESEYNIRGDFFKKLCEYKKVDSVGTYLNNTGVIVNNADGTKRAYLKKSKFSLCFESTAHGGFNTEKIVDAFRADTIPVYYGDPYIGDIFNKKAFIDLADFDSFDAAIERIKELDNDDEKYLNMLNQPVFVDHDYPERLEQEYEAFLVHIFEQDKEKAYRRSRVYFARYYEMFVRHCRMLYNSKPVQLWKKIRKKFK